MGMNCSAVMMVGVPVSREDFWRTTEECRCRTHGVQEGKFCQECGASLQYTEVATSLLRKIAKSQDLSPSDAWENLNWHEGLYAYHLYERPEYILGLQVADVEFDANPPMRSFSQAEIIAYVTRCATELGKVGIKKRPQVFMVCETTA